MPSFCTAVLTLLCAIGTPSGGAGEALQRAVAALDADAADAAVQALGDALVPPATADEMAQAHFLAARAHLRRRLPAAALAMLVHLEDALPELADGVLALRAAAERDLDNMDAAVATWQALRRNFPMSPWRAEAAYGIADALDAAGAADAAAIAYGTALATAPGAAEAARAQLRIAAVDVARGRRAAALARLTRLAAGGPAAAAAEAQLVALAAANGSARRSPTTSLRAVTTGDATAGGAAAGGAAAGDATAGDAAAGDAAAGDANDGKPGRHTAAVAPTAGMTGSGPQQPARTAGQNTPGQPLRIFELLSAADRLLAARATSAVAPLLAAAVRAAGSAADCAAIRPRQAQLALRRHDAATALALGRRQCAEAETGAARAEAQRQLAALLAATGDSAAASRLYLEAAAAGGAAARDAHYRAAWLAFDAGDLPRARELFAAFQREHPTDASREVPWYAAWTAYRDGDLAAARAGWAAALQRRQPPEIEARAAYWLGRVAAQQGDDKAARAAFLRASARPTTYYAFMARQQLAALPRDPPTDAASGPVAARGPAADAAAGPVAARGPAVDAAAGPMAARGPADDAAAGPMAARGPAADAAVGLMAARGPVTNAVSVPPATPEAGAATLAEASATLEHVASAAAAAAAVGDPGPCREPVTLLATLMAAEARAAAGTPPTALLTAACAAPPTTGRVATPAVDAAVGDAVAGGAAVRCDDGAPAAAAGPGGRRTGLDLADAASPEGSAATGAKRPSAHRIASALPRPPLPWDDDALAWDHPTGRRFRRLLQLGLRREAAREVRLLVPAAGKPPRAVAYARARIALALDDFAGAARQADPALLTADGGGARTALQLAYPQAYADTVAPAAAAAGVDAALVLAVMRRESGFRDGATSARAAHGLMQVLPATAAAIRDRMGQPPMAPEALLQPAANIALGAWYLGGLLADFAGQVVPTIGSYNAGPRAMRAWLDARGGSPTDAFIEDIPFRETRAYVKAVLANLAVYAELYGDAPLHLPDTVASDYRTTIDF